jgi:hypothetical protein
MEPLLGSLGSLSPLAANSSRVTAIARHALQLRQRLGEASTAFASFDD